MRRFVLGWKVIGHEKLLDAHIVNYADDFVICCRGTGVQAMTAMRQIMERLKLTVNETKTRQCRVPDDSFDFLGYTIGRCYSPKTGRAYIGTRPSKQKVQRLCREISDMTSCRWRLIDTQDWVAKINRKLIGWSNYFCLGPVSPAYAVVDILHRNQDIGRFKVAVDDPFLVSMLDRVTNLTEDLKSLIDGDVPLVVKTR